MSLVRDLEKTFSDLWHHEASAKAPDSTWVRVRPRADTRLCVHGGRMQTPGSVYTGRLRADSRLCVYTRRLGADTRLCVFREATCRHQALCAGRPRADTRLCVYREAACRHQAASLPIFSLASLTESLHIDGRSEVLSGGRAQSVLVSSWLCSSGGPVAPGAAHLAGLSVFCVLGRISRMGGPWYLL